MALELRCDDTIHGRERSGHHERNTLFPWHAVPFSNLIDYLEGGHSLGEFLRLFPTVSREMAIGALEEARESLLTKIA